MQILPFYALLVGCLATRTTVATPTGGVDSTAPTQPTGPVTWDCDDLPTKPLEQENFPAFANEDITMDAEGRILGADNFRNLWATDADGTQTMILPSSGVDAGIRLMWWDGWLASVQYGPGALYRIHPRTGAKELMAGGLASASGVEIGADRAVWFGELAGNRVQRYDPETDELRLITDQLERPNGLTFNRDYDRLYVAATGEGHIYAIDIDPATSDVIGEPWVFVADAGNGIDGLSVDACGNLYAAWWAEARIVRYSEDGTQAEVLVDKPGANFALGNFTWGREEFGWSPTTIYVVKYGLGKVRSFELGVGEKPRPPAVIPI